MKLIFTSYTSTPEFNDPDTWLERINGYTGILESLAKHHSVVGIERINYEGIEERNGVIYHFIRLEKDHRLFPLKLHALIKRLEPDVVFINGFIFPLQIIQLRMVIGQRVKIVVLHRAEKPFTGVKKFLQQRADLFVFAYLFSSKSFEAEWAGIIKNRNKIHEVIQGSSRFSPMDKPLARSRTGVSGSPAFLWVGRLDKNKDPVTVVKAFLQFATVHPLTQLYMIYQEAELLPFVHELIAEHPAGSNCVLIGERSHLELQDWYSSTDFMISGSHYEGSGIAISEGMSCGCIPIVTNIPSFRAMTRNGSCGRLYAAGNAEELLQVLEQTISMDLEKEKENVLYQFDQELSFDAISRKIQRIIE